MDNVTNSTTFCPLPWIGLRVDHQGSVGFCSYCQELGNTRKDSVETILSSSIATEVKKSIMNNTWHSVCNYCENSEKYGGRSERLRALQSLPSWILEKIIQYPDTTFLIEASINWNNLCNLTCVYCNPQNSTSWGQLNKKTIEIASLDTSDSEDSILKYIEKNKDTLQSLMLGGGEPLLHKKSVQILDILIKKDFNLTIATNLSVPLLTNPLYAQIQKYTKQQPKINWMISFDNLDKKFEYVRHGASWTVFTENICILKEHGHRVIAHPAFGLHCVLDLQEYVKFCSDNDLEIFWCDIFDPKELDIRYAPKPIRELAIKNINDVLLEYSSHNNLSLETLSQYKEMATTGYHFINGDNNDKIRAKDILNFHTNIEKQLSKTTSFKDLWPHEYKILTELQ